MADGGGRELTAEGVLTALVAAVGARLPAGVSRADLTEFVARHRGSLLALIRAELLPVLGRRTAAAGGRGHPSVPDLPELWKPSQRTAANLAALELLARGGAYSSAERRTLQSYSGWGGLSIEKVADRFPAGLPAPEARGLIHEFYTPTAVAREVARVVRPLLSELGPDGVEALEPSAGIGRFLAAFADPPVPVRWHVAEWSEVSARLLAALYPTLDLHPGPFERWVREHGASWAGRLQLVVANPPYGARGMSKTEDPDRDYRERMAYPYFLRRGLDLLAPNGLGVFLIPAGFLTGTGVAMRALREKVLRRHHLAAAYRLPSVGPDGREALFPGAMLVTDLLFFRARGGELDVFDADDEGILAGRYFEAFPRHVLGVEIGQDAGDDDQSKRPRNRYQVQGRFEGLPDLVERPMCADCRVLPVARPAPAGGRVASPRVGVVRAEGPADVDDLPNELARAVTLGERVDRYLASVAAGNVADPPMLWPELHAGLTAWAAAHGNPHASVGVVKLARGGTVGAERFLSAFDRNGRLIPGLARAPEAPEARWRGRPEDIAGQADLLYRTAKRLTWPELAAFHASAGGTLAPVAGLRRLLDAGWCIAGDTCELLEPADVYYTGNLWPKYDAAVARANGDEPAHQLPAKVCKERAGLQARKLLETIAPAVFDDIDGVSPRQGWIPLELVSGWIYDTFHRRWGYPEPELVRENGLVRPGTVGGYDDLDPKGERGLLHPETVQLIGWINHDKTLFKPKAGKDDDGKRDLDKARFAKAAEWEASFAGWLSARPERVAQVEEAYNRQFRGFVAPDYTAEALPVARWAPTGVRLHPHQVAGARRVLANRGGLLAFDVGVGKTYTGIAILARARQEGWAKRPVILVPNSIVWKWYADIQRVLPDYRVAVIGSNRKVVGRGTARGQVTSETDSPTDRGEKWTRFQAGEYDAVLLTYTALSRTRMNEKAVRAYADATSAIRREIELRRRNIQKKKKLTEREAAILEEGVAGWVAEMMELPQGWAYDPGVAWDDIGVDFLLVDEAQNFKNLYLPEDREGGVPRFMGNPGDGSKRAWQLDFRCASVRRRSGGAGVVLLSATPAKNSPLEFYNLIQYVDPTAWTRMGIRDPEQFIDRYLKIEIQPVVTPSMEVEERGAVVGFQNLHELRDVVFRYGEFKTAEDVGLTLPEPKVEMVEVDMDAAQDAKYDRYVREIEAALESKDASDKAKILGLLARMALVAIHAELDDGYSWKNASQVTDPSSPKFEALAERVLANRHCGHIVFVDNVAAHAWVRDVLVNAGIDRARIAILNAETAKPADRTRIAREFNGSDGPPRFDVVIANAVAYEGIDLQTRTCAIHHLDLPWEPATLQQRNGRGVRQGNTLSAIAIYYYFARRSQDGLRFNLIQGKRGWMTQLVKSQDRDTNNPGAQTSMGPEEILLLISRNPEQTRARLDAVRKEREAEARKRVAEGAAQLLRSINTRFRNAARSRDAEEQARLRGEAEARLGQLLKVDPEAWPYARWAAVTRTEPVLVPGNGGPLWSGLKIAIPNAYREGAFEYVAFGRVQSPPGIAMRAMGDSEWRVLSANDGRIQGIKPEWYDATWSVETDDAQALVALRARMQNTLRYNGDWPGLLWRHADDPWRARMWSAAGRELIDALARVNSYVAEAQRIPMVLRGGLHIGRASHVGGGEVLPPTDAGYERFLALAPASERKFGELAEAGQWWWGRTIPRDLLSAARGAA